MPWIQYWRKQTSRVCEFGDCPTKGLHITRLCQSSFTRTFSSVKLLILFLLSPKKIFTSFDVTLLINSTRCPSSLRSCEHVPRLASLFAKSCRSSHSSLLIPRFGVLQSRWLILRTCFWTCFHSDHDKSSDMAFSDHSFTFFRSFFLVFIVLCSTKCHIPRCAMKPLSWNSSFNLWYSFLVTRVFNSPLFPSSLSLAPTFELFSTYVLLCFPPQSLPEFNNFRPTTFVLASFHSYPRYDVDHAHHYACCTISEGLFSFMLRFAHLMHLKSPTMQHKPIRLLTWKKDETDGFFPDALPNCQRNFSLGRRHAQRLWYPYTSKSPHPSSRDHQMPVSHSFSWIHSFSWWHQFSVHTCSPCSPTFSSDSWSQYPSVPHCTRSKLNHFRKSPIFFQVLVWRNELSLPFFPFFSQWQLQLCFAHLIHKISYLVRYRS